MLVSYMYVLVRCQRYGWNFDRVARRVDTDEDKDKDPVCGIWYNNVIIIQYVWMGERIILLPTRFSAALPGFWSLLLVRIQLHW